MRPLRIGLSSCFFHADPKRAIFKGKTLLYLEQSISLWLLSQGALCYMIPQPAKGGRVTAADLAEPLDALVLQGGSDVAPESYGEQPLKPEWTGDRVRDLYEIELVHAFQKQKKPILGVCRGLQLLNVAFGGTLYQDIETQKAGALSHRNWEIYDQNAHAVEISGPRLKKIYGIKTAKVNSVHHQGIKDLAKGFVVEATSEKDAIIEAFRLESDDYVLGVQWHPEFHFTSDKSFLDSAPLLQDFLAEVEKSRRGRP